jgi:hypothetical protein
VEYQVTSNLHPPYRPKAIVLLQGALQILRLLARNLAPIFEKFPQGSGFRSGKNVFPVECQTWLPDYGVDEAAYVDAVVSDCKNWGGGGNGLKPDMFTRRFLAKFSND